MAKVLKDTGMAESIWWAISGNLIDCDHCTQDRHPGTWQSTLAGPLFTTGGRRKIPVSYAFY